MSRKQPHRINDVLKQVLSQVEQQHGVLVTVRAEWSGLVGKRLAKHTTPVSFRRGTLVIHADRPGDNFTLSYQRAELLARLQQLTEGRIERLLVRPGAVT